LEHEARGRVGRERERLTELEARADHRDTDTELTERAEEHPEAVIARNVVALVEHDDRGCARGLGVRRLDREVAAAALDERDVARREVGEVLRLATRGGG